VPEPLRQSPRARPAALAKEEPASPILATTAHSRLTWPTPRAPVRAASACLSPRSRTLVVPPNRLSFAVLIVTVLVPMAAGSQMAFYIFPFRVGIRGPKLKM
jgi:hypothetical protein